jgi:hypothetical protein
MRATSWAYEFQQSSSAATHDSTQRNTVAVRRPVAALTTLTLPGTALVHRRTIACSKTEPILHAGGVPA